MQFVVDCFSYLRIVLNNGNSLLLQIAHLPLCPSLALRNNRSRMAHSFLLRRGLSAYERNNRLIKSAFFYPVGGLFLVISSNLSYQQNSLSFFVVFEVLQAVNKTSAVQRVSSNSNHQRLSQILLSSLLNCFISQSSRSRNNSHLSSLVDFRRHDSDSALIGFDYAWAVRTDQSRFVLCLQSVFYIHHVVQRDSLCDGNY